MLVKQMSVLKNRVHFYLRRYCQKDTHMDMLVHIATAVTILKVS